MLTYIVQQFQSGERLYLCACPEYTSVLFVTNNSSALASKRKKEKTHVVTQRLFCPAKNNKQFEHGTQFTLSIRTGRLEQTVQTQIRRRRT